MSTTPPATAYLTAAEAAAVLRLGPQTLARWRMRGCGPRYRRVGRNVLYTREDLRAWVDQHAFENTAQEGYSR